MKIKILCPGLLASIQDMGRPGWQAEGVPPGGAADTFSHRIANYLAGNDEHAATLELAGGGFSAMVEQGGLLVYAGAGGRLFCNKKELPRNRTLFVPKIPHWKSGRPIPEITVTSLFTAAGTCLKCLEAGAPASPQGSAASKGGRCGRMMCYMPAVRQRVLRHSSNAGREKFSQVTGSCTTKNRPPKTACAPSRAPK
ncbi:MAG: hypothetical protein IPJ82_19845 [Lewinellaceae bacterium]|nr:hypothetical protein [Lewinellaceae bacterium]